eukprot:TRINITY_DN81053_c0_g1_i1.p1 TRINITY_DN81053_c0_g1~~TRINITY_DN81053_c0_g1_i1.p1  ORF type:complete len:181 (+),score=51.81 TRINITY_DN81053_c0_g1_i1:145-687(+)
MAKSNAKKRHQTNEVFLRWLQYSIAAQALLFFVIRFFMHHDITSTGVLFTAASSGFSQWFVLRYLRSLEKVKFEGDGRVKMCEDLVSGEGFIEYSKDVFFVMTLVFVLCGFSFHFMWVSLIIPAVAIYKVLKDIVFPLLKMKREMTEPSASGPVDDKRQAKMERKMKRQQMMMQKMGAHQ